MPNVSSVAWFDCIINEGQQSIQYPYKYRSHCNIEISLEVWMSGSVCTKVHTKKVTYLIFTYLIFNGWCFLSQSHVLSKSCEKTSTLKMVAMKRLLLKFYVEYKDASNKSLQFSCIQFRSLNLISFLFKSTLCLS